MASAQQSWRHLCWSCCCRCCAALSLLPQRLLCCCCCWLCLNGCLEFGCFTWNACANKVHVSHGIDAWGGGGGQCWSLEHIKISCFTRVRRPASIWGLHSRGSDGSKLRWKGTAGVLLSKDSRRAILLLARFECGERGRRNIIEEPCDEC